ncbi:EpsG family protein [Burkholderia guangdongensis]|uniref:EpsG family protein n=1 Tax=Burkholderia guangdongensis TaxID=1792500 RepID=UPI0015C945A6|nr:EpsG family protein [Burkholderia guangdongensis]
MNVARRAAWATVALATPVALPFGAFYGALLAATLAAAVWQPGRRTVAALCVGAVLTLGPLVALKLPLPIGGNDKPQYLDFMRELHAYGMEPYMARQPEFVSFVSLSAAEQLAGTGDAAFLLLFVAYFSLLLAAIWAQQYQAIPLFLVLLLSASSFYGTYGNLIRQSMALPFLFMMIGARGRVTAGCCMALAALAHLPALVVGAPYLLYRLLGKCAVPLLAAVAAGAAHLPGLGAALLGGGDSYLSNKVDLYASWDNDSIAGVALFASAIASLCALLWWRGDGWRARSDAATRALAWRYLAALGLAALALVATRGYTKVFERIYIYFFVIALMYLALVISRVAPGPRKGLVLACAIGYGVYGFAKNLDVQPLLFQGDPYGFLTANLADLYRGFLLQTR